MTTELDLQGEDEEYCAYFLCTTQNEAEQFSAFTNETS